MPFAFALPTTSAVNLTLFATSSSHPSLVLSATTSRQVLRSTLKDYKRTTGATRSSALQSVQNALDEYLPYLFTIDAGLSDKLVSGEDVEVILAKELEVEWSSTLGVRSGLNFRKVKLKSFEYELFFVLQTLAFVKVLLARDTIYANVYGPYASPSDQRTAVLSNAAKKLLDAASISEYLIKRAEQLSGAPAAVEAASNVQVGLSALQLAEATLLVAFKDDPYPAAAASERNPDDKDWMIQPLSIPKVKAQNCARLCLAAAEHCAKAVALLRRGDSKIDEALPKYAEELYRTARARACRFFAIGAEMVGKTGEAIAWLRGANRELGFASDNEEQSLRGFAKLKKDWKEKREDRKIEKGSDWGRDAGKFEEGRIIAMLEKKYNKQNELAVPPFAPLLAGMPAGRDFCTIPQFTPTFLASDALSRMRASPEPGFGISDDGSSDEDAQEPPGAFPESYHRGEGYY